MGDGQLALKPGWIEKAAKQAQSSNNHRLSLLLTRELSAHQWGQLLTFAQEHKIKLDLQVAPGVSLPERFPKHIKEAFEVALVTGLATLESPVATNLKKLASAKAHVFIAEDIDYAIAKLKDQYQDPEPIKVIDISECEASDLLASTIPHFNKETLDYTFTQEIKALWTALEKGETVILKGHFKEELIDALAPLCSNEPHFWLNGERRTFTGKLILVTDNQKNAQKNFSFASTTLLPSAKNDLELFSLLQRDCQERYAGIFLSEKVKSTIKKLSENPKSKKYSFIEWQSILEHQLCFPNEQPDKNWQGLQSLNESTANILETELTFDKQTVEESKAFEENRLKQINDALTFRPFVFIAGSTGAGKSTFVKQQLKTHPGYKVFFENQENQLQAWATDETPHVKKTLFIDEANIDKGDFSAYEGLFNTPPSILINGIYHTLTPEHKIVFAGNPLSYGSREMPKLFERRGGSVIFTPLTPAYLYVNVLQPLVKDYLKKHHQKTVGKQLLKAYQYISKLSNERILISPRELQMMALLVVKKSQEKPEPTIDDCISYAIHTIGSAVVPEQHKSAFNQWCTANKFEKPILPPSPPPFPHLEKEKSKSFVVTKSRNPAYTQILDFLSIRALKQENTTNEKFKYAGLGGMVLEGEPGVGKSHFVIDTLISQGFKQIHWKPMDEKFKKELATEAPANKTFYNMPVSMQLSEKKKLLLQAFDEGAIVIIDEINSSPMMEDLLNDLLMGIHGNRRPTHPGFMIIGTQNPISMEGRIAASTALERRLFKVDFPPYEPPEMKEILQNKGLDLAKTEELVEQYRKARKYALANNKNPPPTFRDLIKIAELYQKTQIAQEKKLVSEKDLDEKTQVEVVMHLPQKLEELTLHLAEGKLAEETKSDSPFVPIVPAFSQKTKHAETKNNDETRRLPPAPTSHFDRK